MTEKKIAIEVEVLAYGKPLHEYLDECRAKAEKLRALCESEQDLIEAFRQFNNDAPKSTASLRGV